ncbi:MAG: DUF308 domain-containing protein [Anaerolineales bacterium]|nr:DUF308 domain-containing protein [Anaerolineales bacterium]
MILGLFLLAKPGMTMVVVVQIIGIYWFVAGIFQIVAIFIDHTQWGWKLFSGILGIIAGMIIIKHPLWSPIMLTSVLVIVLGIEGLIIGIINLIQAFKGGGWGVGILGVISIMIGIVLLGNAFELVTIVPWVVGIIGIVGGVIAIIYSFRLK